MWWELAAGELINKCYGYPTTSKLSPSKAAQTTVWHLTGTTMVAYYLLFLFVSRDYYGSLLPGRVAVTN